MQCTTAAAQHASRRSGPRRLDRHNLVVAATVAIINNWADVNTVWVAWHRLAANGTALSATFLFSTMATPYDGWMTRYIGHRMRPHVSMRPPSNYMRPLSHRLARLLWHMMPWHDCQRPSGRPLPNSIPATRSPCDDMADMLCAVFTAALSTYHFPGTGAQGTKGGRWSRPQHAPLLHDVQGPRCQRAWATNATQAILCR